jgi:apolipoprotein N-acyltransferase
MFLGAALGASYCLVTVGAASWGTPGPFLVKFLSLNLLFVLYGLLVHSVARHIGFNIVVIAALWLPVEYLLSHYAHLWGIFNFAGSGSVVLGRVGSLFGVLMVSFLVVLINSLILIASEHVVRALSSSGTSPSRSQRRERFVRPIRHTITKKQWVYALSPRAPPS